MKFAATTNFQVVQKLFWTSWKLVIAINVDYFKGILIVMAIDKT